MKRHEWEFSYDCEIVGAAAKKKRLWHETREKYWLDQTEKAKTELKEKGIEIRDYDPDSFYTSNKSQTSGMQITVDPSLKRRYDDCRTKVLEHQGKIREYTAFEAALINNTGKSIILNVDDINFFGMYGTDEETDEQQEKI